MITVSYMDGDTQKRLESLAKAAGVALRDVARDEMRLGLNNAIKYTQPAGKGKPAQGKREGQARVDQDIRKIFIAYDNPEIVETYKIRKKKGGGRLVKMSKGGAYNVAPSHDLTSWSESRFEQAHKGQRNNRTGRVFKLKAKSKNRRTEAGIFVDRPHTTERNIKRFIRLQQKRVGQLKAGWIPALVHYAGLSNGRATIPAWVGKTPQRMMGAFFDSMRADGSGAMAGTNETPYWTQRRQADLENLVHSIMQKRLNTSKRLQGRIDNLQKQFNASEKVNA